MKSLRAILANVLGRLYGGTSGRRGYNPEPYDFPDRDPEVKAQAQSAIHSLLSDIELGALETYAAHELPTRPGQYATSPRGKGWKFVGENLSAEERWSLALENGSTAGWKFKALEDLGAGEIDDSGDLAKASDILRACRTLKDSLQTNASPTFADDLERAIRLGADWQQNRLVAERKDSGGLRFNAATPSKPARPSGSKARPSVSTS